MDYTNLIDLLLNTLAYCYANMCPSTPLWIAIGGMIFVARGNTYFSFVLLADSLNGANYWIG